jgi:hypothetical protein
MALLRLNRNPSRRQLRVFAAAWFVFLGLAALRAGMRSHREAAEVCAGLAIVVPGVGLIWLAGLRALYRGLSYLTYPIGVVVSSGVLTLLYYLVLTPIGLLVRICGHDALQRGLDRPATSYWQKRRPASGSASYFRQH